MLESICDAMDWSYGALWRPSSDGCLRCTILWHRPEPGARMLAEASSRLAVELGEGLPGRALQAAAPSWLPDVTQESMPRASVARDAGLRTALAIPLRTGDRAEGVVEFFAAGVRETEPDVLTMLELAGSQLAQYLQRWRDQETIRAGEARYRAAEVQATGIVEAALDCIIAIGPDGRVREFNPAAERTFGYRRSDVLGRELSALIVPPELREQHRAGLARQLAGGEATILGRRAAGESLGRASVHRPRQLQAHQRQPRPCGRRRGSARRRGPSRGGHP